MIQIDQNFKNISPELQEQLSQVILPNVTKTIVPGQDYIPVTGKVLDVDDLLYGVEATMDGWLTTGRFGPKFEQKLARLLRLS
jgi:CDP-6-deoxy-D-xylo-4-hexulose-3-dehydrase